MPRPWVISYLKLTVTFLVTPHACAGVAAEEQAPKDLEVGEDALSLAIANAVGQITIITLQQYFVDHPEHTAQFWRKTIVDYNPEGRLWLDTARFLACCNPISN